MAPDRPVLPGSARRPLASAQAAGELDTGSRLEVTVVLRRRAELPAELPQLSTAQFADAYGADPADVATAREALTGEGLEVTAVDVASRRLQVRGTVADLQRAFGTDLAQVESHDPVQGRAVTHRQRSGMLAVPAALADVVVAVLGLDDRPQARTRFRPAAATGISYTPIELARVYRFPDGTDGSGQTLAILELGGGYAQADLDAYWTSIGLADPPTVTAVGVDGGANAPAGDPNGADGEVLLDIEVAGALAPGADVVVYFAPNTDRGFLDALAGAVHADPTPAAVSISWGRSEDGWTAQARTAMEEALADAAALGVTVTAAAGDRGSADGEGGGGLHTDFPASSPHLLACGGTKLAVADGGTVASETVWNGGERGGATGGGVSVAFGLPAYQRNAGVDKRRKTGKPGRGVPDVAAVADPATGYEVLVDGEQLVFGGTSAVAPLWAALVARLTQALGRPLGLLNTALYDGAQPGRTQPGFRDVTEGDNDISGKHGPYPARTGWDACTGLGVPEGEALLAALRKLGKE